MLWFAVLHFVVLKLVEGTIFLVSHVPPKAVNLDGVYAFFVHIEDVLKFPRWVVGRLWPWETTPAGYGLALTIFNSALWGAALAALRNLWRKATA